MEMIRGSVHKAFDVLEPSQVGEVRRAAALLSGSLGFDEVAAGRVAIVATELGTNLVKHARGGRLLVGERRDARGLPQIELLSIDRGPGIRDVANALTDGVSSAGTAGNGLGAVRRLADEFDLFSAPTGTVVLARVQASSTAAAVAPPRPFEVAAVALPAPGETVCGDGWAFAQQDGEAALVVADGLGHGPEAAQAAGTATSVFERFPFEAPNAALARMHQAMRSTRGAAVAWARTEADGRGIRYCGAGNISARLISGTEDRSLVSHHGTVGLAVRQMQELRYDWPEHALLVMHSDGLVSRWTLQDHPGLLRHSPAVIAAWLLAAHGRGRDDATVVVLKRNRA